MLFIASISDLKTRRIPNQICVAVALTGFIDFAPTNGLGIALAIPFFIAAILTGEECMGGGDIKMIAAMGFALGYAVMLKCMAALFVILGLLMIIERITQGCRRFAVPLIPFLTIAYIITIIIEVL